MATCMVRTGLSCVRTNRAQSQTALIPSQTTPPNRAALVPSNPRVKAIAFRLRWSPDTVVRRVMAALPSPIEQRLYLHIGREFRIQPETLRKLLDVFCECRSLTPSDLSCHDVGARFVVSRFEVVAEQVEEALIILDKTGDVMPEQPIAIATVARLVEMYGGRVAEDTILMVCDGWQELAERLQCPRASKNALVGHVLSRLSEHRGLCPMSLEDIAECLS